MRKLISIAAGVALALSLGVGGVLAGGPPAVGFYADGDLYRTIGTPADFSGTGAPDSSYETIWALGNGLMNVAEAAPGQPGFRGGRWQVVEVIWNITPTQYRSAAEVLAAEAAGDIDFGAVLKKFECPVIPLPRNA